MPLYVCDFPHWRTVGRCRSERSTSHLLSVEPLEARNLLSLQGNVLFPADNPWNQVIAAAPVAGNSATLVASIGASGQLHPDFGTIYEGAYIGIPVTIVSGSQPRVEVIVDAYPDESDLVDVPIPAGAVIEGDPLPSEENEGDRHLLVYDQDNNVAYELYNVHRPSETGDGKWHADSIAVWDMSQNSFRTPGDTSADAAGLPILPGLVRPDEVLDQGVINHALRFTVPSSRNQYVYPASHQAGVSNVNYPRMGERFRLKADFDISGFSPANQVILLALKNYGMIVADNGSGWYLSGEPSSRWDDDDLHELSSIVGNNFEAVDLRPIVTQVSPATGPAGTSVTIVGKNFSGAAGQLQVLFGGTAATNINVLSDSTVVATSPAHAAGTVQVSVVTPYGTSATSAGSQFTFASGAAVVDRHIFYNQSAWDGNSAAINPPNDNAAIATDKDAYQPNGTTAVFNNITSYSRGINGIMVDLSAGGNHAAISASDFIFKVGNNNAPSSWVAAPAPAGVSVVPGGGVGGSDRVIITWAAGAIRNQWLEVQVKANANTGLAAADVHFWGNRIGDSGTSTLATTFNTNATDSAQAIATVGVVKPITDLRDFNRDKAVNATDSAIVFANVGMLNRLSVATVGPFAPVADPTSARDNGRSAVATGLGQRVAGQATELLPTADASKRYESHGEQSRHQLQSAVAADPHFEALSAASNSLEDILLAFDDELCEPVLATLG